MLEEKFYYTIGEVAKEFNINPTTLRYWEKTFTVLKPDKNKRGARLYKQQDIKIISKIVYLLKEKKLTINGVKKELNNNKIHGDKQEVLKTLLDIKNFLTKLKENLN